MESLGRLVVCPLLQPSAPRSVAITGFPSLTDPMQTGLQVTDQAFIVIDKAMKIIMIDDEYVCVIA